MVSVDAGDAPALSVVIVTHDMARELPRTLRSLAPPYQRGIARQAYEVLVVDNGSARPVELARDGEPDVRLLRLDDAAVSPARAANVGLAAARGDVIGLIIDGARMASPGLLSAALLASTVVRRSVVTAPAWHLGASLQAQAQAIGYDQSAEDALLERVRWEADGYALFGVSTPAASSARGLFGPMGESSSLFLHRETWAELGGVDERFSLPGGGLVNHDLYRRACTLEGAQLVVLLGEGTFHQIHGGAATSGRITSEEMRADYEAIIGEPHRPPPNRALYLGSIPSTYLPYLASSVDLARSRGSQPAGERL